MGHAQQPVLPDVEDLTLVFERLAVVLARQTMGLPGRQSVCTCAPKKYCRIVSGAVSAIHTCVTGASISTSAVATKFAILLPPRSTENMSESYIVSLQRSTFDVDGQPFTGELMGESRDEARLVNLLGAVAIGLN